MGQMLSSNETCGVCVMFKVLHLTVSVREQRTNKVGP